MRRRSRVDKICILPTALGHICDQVPGFPFATEGDDLRTIVRMRTNCAQTGKSLPDRVIIRHRGRQFAHDCMQNCMCNHGQTSQSLTYRVFMRRGLWERFVFPLKMGAETEGHKIFAFLCPLFLRLFAVSARPFAPFLPVVERFLQKIFHISQLKCCKIEKSVLT